MTETSGLTRTTLTRGDQDIPLRVPAFVCVLPCTKPAVKYGDGLEGCADGIHTTLEDTQDLQVLYDRMANVVLTKNTPLEEEEAPEDPCAVCLAPIVPSSSSPVMFMELCPHHFHYYCYEVWRSTRWKFGDGNFVKCPTCRTDSSRTLLWPQLFSDPEAKNQLFQLQKRIFGLDVEPETVVYVSCSELSPYVFVAFNKKVFILMKRFETSPIPRMFLTAPGPGQEPASPITAQQEPLQEPPPQPTRLEAPPQAPVVEQEEFEDIEHYLQTLDEVTESTLVKVIQKLHLADPPRRFNLGDILPLEETPQYRAVHWHSRLSEEERREKLLLQFWCPFDRANVQLGKQCEEGVYCKFFHGWPQDTPAYIKERVIVRQFPSFFCLGGTKFFACVPKCSELIRVHSQEFTRCTTSFHPTSQDLKDIDGFASKMAKLIMSPVVVPEPSQRLVCSFCRKSAQPNSIWIHMQNCSHCLHVNCLPLVRHNYRHLNRKLDVHCPACQVSSVRTIAWPGQFPCDMVKEAIFKRQLYEFKLEVQSDTQVAVVQVANQANIFTVDYGGPRVVTIDWAKFSLDGQNGNVFWI